MGRVKIGTPNYGGNRRKFEKLKDGEAVYGILPPLGDLAAKGRWSVYYRIHYGYKNSEGKTRAFQSCLVKNRKPPYMVEVPDAAVERLDLLKGQLEKAKKAGDEKAKEALFKLVGGQKSLYNLDNNHYVNAIDLQGNIVILKLRHKAKLALDVEIEKLRKKGIEPNGVQNRRFFTFSRSGMGQDTTYKVSVYQETVSATLANGQKADLQQDLVHNLSDDILDRLGNEAGKLDKLFKSPTSEQVAQIVKESNILTGISPNIDAILDLSQDGTAEDNTDDSVDAEDIEDTTTTTNAATFATTPNAVVAPPPATIVTAPAPAPTVAAAPAPTPAPAPKAAPTNTTEKLAEMSDKDFLASLGIPS